MAERPRFFDDLAGVAGGALSALAGVREEAEAMVRARIDEAIRKLDLVRRDELDAVAELAANARAGQEAAEARLAAMEARVAALESRSSGVDAISPGPVAPAAVPPITIVGDPVAARAEPSAASAAVPPEAGAPA